VFIFRDHELGRRDRPAPRPARISASKKPIALRRALCERSAKDPGPPARSAFLGDVLGGVRHLATPYAASCAD